MLYPTLSFICPKCKGSISVRLVRRSRRSKQVFEVKKHIITAEIIKLGVLCPEQDFGVDKKCRKRKKK